MVPPTGVVVLSAMVEGVLKGKIRKYAGGLTPTEK
jgi:hypothetical protein